MAISNRDHIFYTCREKNEREERIEDSFGGDFGVTRGGRSVRQKNSVSVFGFSVSSVFANSGPNFIQKKLRTDKFGLGFAVSVPVSV
jgi:hypothetical protein